MKTLSTIFLLLFAGAIHGQKYFKGSIDSSYRMEILKPSFEHQTFDITGKVCTGYLFTEGIYFKTFFNKALESMLPMDSIDRLTTYSGRSTRSMLSILIDPAGKIWNIYFVIPIDDRKILTDEVLYRLYQKIGEMRIDMNRVRIDPAGVPDKNTYGTHTIFLYTWPEKEKKYN